MSLPEENYIIANKETLRHREIIRKLKKEKLQEKEVKNGKYTKRGI